MKSYWKIYAGMFLLIISTATNSCVKGEFDEPPILIPKVDFQANTTIAQLKASYTGLKQITDDIIIKGIVVANDESGNLYKKMILQDATAGIELALDKTSLYNEYKVGQRVYVKCKDMYIGDYSNLIQLGYLFSGAIGRLPEVFIPKHLFRDSLPGPKPQPQVLASVGAINSSFISKLVRFENVRFTESAVMYAPQTADATNRTLVDAGNNQLVVRTSKYSNFASQLTPKGTGNVTGVLSIFGTTYQLTIRDTSDVKNFTGIDPPITGGDGSKTNPFTVAQAIQKQNASPYVTGWVKGFIVGAVKTGVSTITSANDVQFSGPFTLNTNVLLADDKNETNYLNCVIVNLPSGKPLRTLVNLVDNPANLGKWLNVTGTLRTYFGVAGLRDCPAEATDFELQGGGGAGTIIFAEDFNTSIGTFKAHSVTGAQVWTWGSFDGGCMVMSGFVTPVSYANEDWLVSPAISLVGHTGVTMSFREAINYITSINDMKVFISTNYNGTSAPTASGTWTEITGFTRAPGNNWTFIDSGSVSLATYQGQTIHIAFKYLSTSSASATWEISKVEVKKN